jgi:phosphate transport system protein
MSDTGKESNSNTRQLMELERRLIALGNSVESLFADSVVALLERGPQTVEDLREEDYKAHERWIEVDRLCSDLLADAQPTREQVRFITASIKIAADLRRAADESLRIGESLRSCGGAVLEAEPTDSVPRMVGLTQSMLSDVIEAFLNRDVAEASGLHLVFRELTSLSNEAVTELSEAMQKASVEIQAGTALLSVAQRLERIGDEVLDISNHVSHLYREVQRG